MPKPSPRQPRFLRRSPPWPCFGVGVGEHGDLVAKSVLVVAGPGQGGVDLGTTARFFILRPPPAAIDGIDQRWVGEGDWAIAVAVNAVLNHHGEVLVSTEMAGARLAQDLQGFVAAGLWPAVAVQISEQAVFLAAVEVHGSAEGGLGEGDFHLCIGPVRGPVLEEIELALAE